jgi:hypothetical protein
MTHDDWRDAPTTAAIHSMNVTATNATGFDVDQNFALARLWSVHRLERKGRGRNQG